MYKKFASNERWCWTKNANIDNKNKEKETNNNDTIDEQNNNGDRKKKIRSQSVYAPFRMFSLHTHTEFFFSSRVHNAFSRGSCPRYNFNHYKILVTLACVVFGLVYLNILNRIDRTQ